MPAIPETMRAAVIERSGPPDVVKISASFPLAEAAKAHERIESSHVIGKIVLRVR
jgi:hypothetical protein